jgi:ERCC4-type nuclease
VTEIFIDSREPLEYKIQALEKGDCVFKVNNQLIRIERKNYDDLIQSFRSGRLAIQLNQLSSDEAIPILAIIGYPSAYNHLSLEAERNLILSIKLTGIIVERLANEADYKSRIRELIEYFESQEHTGLIPYRYSNPKLGALMWVAGIGYKKANLLLDTWQGSLIDIYNAPKQALTKILGAVLADRFYSAIRKPVKQATKEDWDLWK